MKVKYWHDSIEYDAVIDTLKNRRGDPPKLHSKLAKNQIKLAGAKHKDLMEMTGAGLIPPFPMHFMQSAP